MDVVAHAQPCWIDLSTTDAASAEDFYRELLGWEVSRSDTPMGEYLIGTVGDQEVAGMMAQSPEIAGAPSMWTVYFFVDDLDAAVGRVTAAGGSVFAAPFEIPDGDRVSIVADPTGAMFGLMSGSEQPGSFSSMTPGAASWFELMTRDTETATGFYADLFGWQSQTDDADGIDYTVFAIGDVQVGGMIATPADLGDDVPNAWSVYFTVTDCAAAEAAVRDLGGQVIKGSTPTPMGPFAVIADPQGAVFQIMEFAGSPP